MNPANSPALRVAPSPIGAALDFADALLSEPDRLMPPYSGVQRAAMEMHAAGLNVIPLPRVKTKDFGGKKPPYGTYSILFTTRLHPDDLPELFKRANVGVIAGRLSQNLFILDCDSPHEFERVGGELARRNIGAWIATSGRGGHYWLRCAEGEVANAKLSDVLQVIGRCGYVVAPPSVHPSGVIYEWARREGELPPLVSIDALDFLPISLAKARRGQLPNVARQVLAERKLGDYASWSEAELSAAMSLAKAGYSEDEIVEAFEQYNPPHFAKRKRPADWLRRYVIPKAIIQADGDRQAAHTGMAWANSRAWPGRTGESDRALFVALCQRAALDGREHFRASVRELSELSGLSIPTVLHALARLIGAGLVKREGRDQTSLASLFSLRVPRCA